MIEKIALSVAVYFADKSAYKRDDVDTYKYGFELLFSTIFNITSIMIISFFMQIAFEGILFLISVISLRVTAGGYHAKGHGLCFLVNNMTYILFVVLLQYLFVNYLIHYSFFSVIAALTIIWFLSPIEAENKPLSEMKKIRVRNKSLIIAFTNIVLVIIFAFIVKQGESLLAYYISGMLAASLSLVAAKINNSKVPHKSYKSNF